MVPRVSVYALIILVTMSLFDFNFYHAYPLGDWYEIKFDLTSITVPAIDLPL